MKKTINRKYIIGIIISVIVVVLVIVLIKFVISASGHQNNISESGDEVHDIVNELSYNLDAGKTTIDIYSKNYDNVIHAIELLYDDPEYFWLSRDYSIVTIKGFQRISFSVYYPEYKDMLVEIDKSANAIIDGIDKNVSDYEKIKWVHDELCSRITYISTDSEDEHNIYGALVKGRAVCEGYAKSFDYILKKLGFETIYFSGTSVKDGISIPHSWNGVYIDDELYYFDVTWDDSDDNIISYSYFGVTSNEILKYHSFDQYHPVIDSKADTYNYYMYNDLILYEYSKENVAALINKQNEIIEIKCNSIIVYENMLSMLESPYHLNEILKMTNKNDKFNSYTYIIDDSTYLIRLFFE
ncbi:MAG: hypothetical protein MJ130_05050 [Lachnospiraceae bacterium]|nr:hypothetical protein [Lachnospiraceae bacterium]